jgi:hypothetical protein
MHCREGEEAVAVLLIESLPHKYMSMKMDQIVRGPAVCQVFARDVSPVYFQQHLAG